MGAELGATTTVFPADERVRDFLAMQGREHDFTPIAADHGAGYEVEDEIDLSTVVPLIATPGSPGNAVPVSEVAGAPVHQVVVGSSANPGLRDVAMVAAILDDQRVHPQVSLDINPTSRQLLAELTAMGDTLRLVYSGARLHQAGCLGCIGMGQAPAMGHNSLRTFPRNFPGRSGTADDQVWLCSPETAAAASLTGVITDPRQLPELTGRGYPTLALPGAADRSASQWEPPLSAAEAADVELERAPSIGVLPDLDPLPEHLDAIVAIAVGDDVSTDEILPAGAQALPNRSNIVKLAEYTFGRLDPDYVERVRQSPGHVIIAGHNYGQGSSREHAAIAPRHLGLRLVIARSYARIHWQNLANFGVLPLEFATDADADKVAVGDRLTIDGLPEALRRGATISVSNTTRGTLIDTRHRLSPRQIGDVIAGGTIPAHRVKHTTGRPRA
jgi:aconitate hydratase